MDAGTNAEYPYVLTLGNSISWIFVYELKYTGKLEHGIFTSS